MGDHYVIDLPDLAQADQYDAVLGVVVEKPKTKVL